MTYLLGIRSDKRKGINFGTLNVLTGIACLQITFLLIINVFFNNNAFLRATYQNS